jgi:hypothetical protein
MIPTNIADAIAAARDGEFGFNDTVKIGDLIVDALSSLSAPESLDITQKAFQDGSRKTDVAVENNLPLSMAIVLANPEYSVTELALAKVNGTLSQFNKTWREKKKELYQMKDDREIIEVQTHDELYTNVMIRSIDPLYDAESNFDAFICTVELERVKIFGADSQTFSKFASPLQSVSG